MDAQRLSCAFQIRTLVNRFAIALQRPLEWRNWDKAVMYTRHAERQLLSEVDIQPTPMLGHLNKSAYGERGKTWI